MVEKAMISEGGCTLGGSRTAVYLVVTVEKSSFRPKIGRRYKRNHAIHDLYKLTDPAMYKT